METGHPGARLPGAQRARALAILRSERDRYVVSPAEKTLYVMLRGSVWACALAYLQLIAVGLLLPSYLGVALSIVVVVYPVSLLLLFVLNAPLIVKMTRRRLRIVRLGLAPVSDAVWRRRERASLLARAWTWAPLAVAAGFAAAVLYLFRDAHGLALAALAAVPLVGHDLVRHAREWHETAGDVDDLAAALGPEPTPDGDGAVQVSRGTLEALARLESAQIARERVAAISAGVGRARAYRIVPTAEFSAARTRLSPGRQAEVQDLVERLAEDPRGEGARPDRRRRGRLLRHRRRAATAPAPLARARGARRRPLRAGDRHARRPLRCPPRRRRRPTPSRSRRRRARRAGSSRPSSRR